MKNYKTLSFIITLALVICLAAVPTFAWYYQTGYLFIKVNTTSVPRQESEFSATYGIRLLSQGQAKLYGVVPTASLGQTVPSTESGANQLLTNSGGWLVSSATQGEAQALDALIESGNAVVLTGSVGSTLSGTDGTGGTIVSPTDPSEPADNDVVLPNLNVAKGFSALSDEVEIDTNNDNNGVDNSEADNRFSLVGNFSSDENKLVSARITVAPKNAESVNDVLAVNSTCYAVYYTKTHNSDGSLVSEAEQTNTIFINNSFNFVQSGASKRAVSQNGAIEIRAGESYTITAVLWLDGYCDPRAESGAILFNIDFSDLSNICPSQDVGFDQTGNVVLNVNPQVANLNVPSYYYSQGYKKSVTAVADNAFENSETLTTATLPDTLESIGVKAFAGCTALRSVSFGHALTTIGQNAFYGCLSLSVATFANPYGWSANLEQLNLDTKTDAEIATLLKSQTVVWAR